MKLTIVACPFQTSYGAYVESLKRAIEKQSGAEVAWVASNCGCGDPMEVGRRFQTQGCRYFEMVNIYYYESTHAWKRKLRMKLRNAVYYFRARKYAQMLKGADVVHFQQILNAYGSEVVFHWLQRRSSAVRVITVHELDPYQTNHPEQNRIYNRADALIVHCVELREKLLALGVEPEKIHVVPYGVDLPSLDASRPREGIVYYGGHHASMTNKGIDVLVRALALLKQRLGSQLPVTRIHGHYGSSTPAQGQELAKSHGVADRIEWLNQLGNDEAVALYGRSMICVLPFSGSFAGYPAGLAAAAAVPVVATRNAGLPDYLGDCGIWIDTGNAEQLADRMAELLESASLRTDVGSRLRRRAEQMLGWDTVAAKTLEIYRAGAGRGVASLSTGGTKT